MKHAIKYNECHGKGVVSLPQHLLETLAMVPARGDATAYGLAEKHENISTNAFSNRLFELLERGFLKRQRDGRFWRYSRA